MKVAVVGKGKSLTNIYNVDVSQYYKIVFLNEAYLFCTPFEGKARLAMFIVDAEPLLRVVRRGIVPMHTILPEYPHFNESKGTISGGDLLNTLGSSGSTYKLIIPENPESYHVSQQAVAAVNSSFQACLNYLGIEGVSEVDAFGIGGETHPLLVFPKKVPRSDYSDQFQFVEKITKKFGMKVNYV